ncbi:MAG: hypothetical protein PHV95_09445 [Eubacteriales bacterium]|nr:hypothetical protein [Eubacteriales bacterium]
MNKTLKTFLVKVLIIMAVLVVVDQGVGVAYKWLRGEALERNPYKENQKLAFMAEKINTDVVIVGASDASHHYISKMIEDSIGMSVYNCGQDGCFFIYQNCAINLMIERYSPKVIIWEMMEDCLSGDITSNHEYQSINLLYPYYSNDYCHKVINEKDKYQRYRMLSMMYRNNSYLRRYIFSLIKSKSSNDSAGYEPLFSAVDNYPSMLIEKDIHQDINENKVKMLTKTIENCRNKGVKLVLASSPGFTDGTVFSSLQFKKLEEVAADYQLPFIEYYKRQDLFRDSTLFKDVSHLNDKGARVWMSYFIPELKGTL